MGGRVLSPRLRARVDGNHPAIVLALRRVGATVQSLAQVGKDCPDLLVGFRRETHLLEVKQPGENPTDGQETWHRAWNGLPVRVVRSTDEALRAIGVGVATDNTMENRR